MMEGRDWVQIKPVKNQLGVGLQPRLPRCFIVGILFPCIPSKKCPPELGRPYPHFWGFPGGTSGKEPTCQSRRHRKCGFNPWVRKIPWRRAWQPTPVFLAGGVHGERSLVGYSPWGCKESDMTEPI